MHRDILGRERHGGVNARGEILIAFAGQTRYQIHIDAVEIVGFGELISLHRLLDGVISADKLQCFLVEGLRVNAYPADVMYSERLSFSGVTVSGRPISTVYSLSVERSKLLSTEQSSRSSCGASSTPGVPPPK